MPRRLVMSMPYVDFFRSSALVLDVGKAVVTVTGGSKVSANPEEMAAADLHGAGIDRITTVNRPIKAWNGERNESGANSGYHIDGKIDGSEG